MGNIKLEKLMSSPSTGTYDIGPPSDYAGGHAAIGTTLFVEAALPIILYYAWMKPRLDDMSYNVWYMYAWKAMTWGSLISSPSPASTDSTSPPPPSSSNSRPSKATLCSIPTSQRWRSGVSSAPSLAPSSSLTSLELTTFGTLSCTSSLPRSRSGARTIQVSARTMASLTRVITEMLKSHS